MKIIKCLFFILVFFVVHSFGQTNPVIGKWKKCWCKDTLETKQMKGDWNIEFKADGTYISNNDGIKNTYTPNGTWVLKGDKLIINQLIEFDKQIATVTYPINILNKNLFYSWIWESWNGKDERKKRPKNEPYLFFIRVN